MPRRGALGVLGVTLAALTTGGTAAGRPFGRKQSRGCGAAYKVCEPASQACFAHCCPKHTTCSFSSRGTNGCQKQPGCCDPCNRERSQPDGQGGCRPGPVPAHCPCRSDQKRCDAGKGQGVVCCEKDEYCATSRKDEGSGSSITATCCKRGETFCLGGPRGVSGARQRPLCCPRGTRCCVLAGKCCSTQTQTCERDGCRCKPGHTVRCGRHCCDPQRQKCCGGPNKRCVPKDRACTP